MHLKQHFQYILTAAHCLSWGKGVTKIKINVGDHHLKKKSEAKNRRFRVKRLLIHKRYDESTTDFDIALIQVRGKIDFADNIRPVCLPKNPRRRLRGTLQPSVHKRTVLRYQFPYFRH